MVFSELTDAELAHDRAAASAAALEAARLAAARRLLSGLPATDLGDAADVVAALTGRAGDARRLELLRAFEKPWALLVLQIISGVTNPAEAVRDARERGATVPEIAGALGITTQGVYATYSNQVVRQARKSSEANARKPSGS